MRRRRRKVRPAADIPPERRSQAAGTASAAVRRIHQTAAEDSPAVGKRRQGLHLTLAAGIPAVAAEDVRTAAAERRRLAAADTARNQAVERRSQDVAAAA